MFVETCNHFGSLLAYTGRHTRTHTAAKEEGMTSNHRNEDWRDAKMYLENWHENWNNNDWCASCCCCCCYLLLSLSRWRARKDVLDAMMLI